MTNFDDGSAPVGELGMAAKALEVACDWDRLRWLVVEGSWAEAPLTASDAAWLDAGSFSRWVMTFTPTPNALLADVRRVPGAGIARRCRSVLLQSGLLSAGNRAAA